MTLSFSPPSHLSRIAVLLALVLCVAASVCAQQTFVTFSGRITDQNTGLGIPDVAVVGQGNQSGTRVAISNAQGNYTLPLGSNTNVRLRAYKSTYVFNPLLVGFSSVGGFPLVGNLPLDFTGAKLPFPILIFAQAPVLLTEDESLKALALDGVLHTRDPLAVNKR
jgi:hypothetical protein